MKHIVKLPNLGENINSGAVAQVLVETGEAVKEGSGLVELETDKAVLEVPSDRGGMVKEILVKEGDEVKIEQDIVVLEVDESDSVNDAETEEGQSDESGSTSDSEESQKIETHDRTSKNNNSPDVHEQKQAEEDNLKKTSGTAKEKSEQDPVKVEKERRDYLPIPASPSIRRFAREIGVDINQVQGSGPRGRISIDDVKEYSKKINKTMESTQSSSLSQRAVTLPDFSKWGEVELENMSKIREKTASHLGFAWTTIPHVTHFDKADITELEKQRKFFYPVVEKAGAKLTMTAILVKFVQKALRTFPQINASIDVANKRIIHKKYQNVGVAVDTSRGLLVPVVKNVEKKNIMDIAIELQMLAEKARSKKITLEEMEGSSFTISNLGGIGGTGFTPIVNSPDVAILAVSRAKIEPVYDGKNFEPRLLLPLALSYDHRIVDGADAARFLRWLSDSLEKPLKVFLEGQ